MILYRPHRGSLKASMAEVKQFDTFEEMAEAICKDWEFHGRPFEPDDIILCGGDVDDDRIGWRNVESVCITAFRNEVFSSPQCIGYCTFKKEEQAPD